MPVRPATRIVRQRFLLRELVFYSPNENVSRIVGSLTGGAFSISKGYILIKGYTIIFYKSDSALMYDFPGFFLDL